MTETKPGLSLDERGLCDACRNAEYKKTVDYGRRFEELKQLCDRYKRDDGYYDCMITVSGGKDSHFQVHVLKERLGMNPLLVTAGDPYTKTKAGAHNIRNLCDRFDCDLITAQLSPALVRKMARIAFEEFGSPSWPVDRLIYCYPIRMAVSMKIPFIIYGENVSWEYGGVLKEETYSAKAQIDNDVAKKVDFSLWYSNGITDKQMNMLKYPDASEIEEAGLEPVYLSYFMPWDGYKHYTMAKEWGFKDLAGEWKRQGYVDDYDQIDSVGYLMNVWMKYPKFGFGRATDVVGYWVRSGLIDREKGKKLIRENDNLLDEKILQDFLQFTGYTREEFWNIVEKFWNRELFERTDKGWKLRNDGLS